MIETEYLKNIEWFIEIKPSVKSIKFRDTFQYVKKQDLDKIVLNFDHDITLSFPLNNDYSAFDNKVIKGKQTLKSLFNIIYKFYEKNMKKTMIKEVFENFPDILEELQKDLDDGNIKYIMNIDGFGDSVCPPDFVGLTYCEKDNTFNVDLGPL